MGGVLLISCKPTSVEEDYDNFESSVDLEDETKDNSPIVNDNEMTDDEIKSLSFILKNNDNSYSAFLIADKTIHIYIPQEIDLTHLIPVFPNNIQIKTVNGIQYNFNTPEVDFNDFLNPIEFVISDEAGKITQITVIIYNLPVLIINTPNNSEILSKETRVEDCELLLINQNGIEELGNAGIKLRGNSTANLPKKPYNIKLNAKKEILGMNESKKWVLLANCYFDRTQLHNATAFEIARQTNYNWVQSGEFIELILNNKHKGLYYLCEKIDIEKNKINIKELKSDDTEYPKITGGYLIEGSAYSETDPSYPISEEFTFNTDYFNTTGLDFDFGLYWILKNPDENVPDEQIEYIKSCVNSMESLIYDDEVLQTGEWKQYLDIESVINWWFVEELTLNWEAARSKNLYMYKNRNDDKFYLGPPWDFDAWTFGLYERKRFYAKESGFYYRQLFKDSSFVQRVKEKWADYKDTFYDEIPQFIDEQYELIHKSAERNEKMWPVWNDWNHYPEKTYEEIVTDMKNCFLEQLEWMDEEIQNL